MTDIHRARLERAMQHPAYREAMAREPADYTVPALLLGLFYLMVPMVFLAPFVYFAAGDVDFIVVIASSFLFGM